MFGPDIVPSEHLPDGGGNRKRDSKDGYANLGTSFVGGKHVHEADLRVEHIGHLGFDLPTFGVVGAQLNTNPSSLWTMRLGRSGHETRIRGSLDDRSPRTFKG